MSKATIGYYNTKNHEILQYKQHHGILQYQEYHGILGYQKAITEYYSTKNLPWDVTMPE